MEIFIENKLEDKCLNIKEILLDEVKSLDDKMISFFVFLEDLINNYKKEKNIENLSDQDIEDIYKNFIYEYDLDLHFNKFLKEIGIFVVKISESDIDIISQKYKNKLFSFFKEKYISNSQIEILIEEYIFTRYNLDDKDKDFLNLLKFIIQKSDYSYFMEGIKKGLSFYYEDKYFSYKNDNNFGFSI